MLPKWAEQAIVTMVVWGTLVVLLRLLFTFRPLVAVVVSGPLVILALFKSIDELITIRLDEEEAVAETTIQTAEQATDD